MTAPVPPPHGVRRSRTNKLLGGVCAGVARSAGLDPLLLRVVVVAVTVLTGGGAAFAYLAAWILIPREESAPGTALPPGTEQAGTPLRVVPGSAAEGPDVRAAWTAAGNDLRSLAAEFRRPPPSSAATTTPTGAGATGTGVPGGSTAPDTTTADAAVETDTETETDTGPTPAPPAGSIPFPRSALTAADDAATTFGDRLRTPEVQAGARKAANSVSEAVNASVDEIGRRIRRDPG